MKTWRIEFTEKELVEIYYAVRDKADSPTVNTKRWRAELLKIANKIMSSGAQV